MPETALPVFVTLGKKLAGLEWDHVRVQQNLIHNKMAACLRTRFQAYKAQIDLMEFQGLRGAVSVPDTTRFTRRIARRFGKPR